MTIKIIRMTKACPLAKQKINRHRVAEIEL